MPYYPTWNNPYLQQPVPQPGAYQPAQAQVMPTVPAYQPPVNGAVRVNGRESALQYPLPPNSTSPALFDNGGKVFYIVTTDGTGTKTVEAFDFVPHKDEEPVRIDGAQFVSRAEFDEFAAKVNAVLGAANGIHGPVQAAATAAAATTAPDAAANGAGAADVPRHAAGG